MTERKGGSATFWLVGLVFLVTAGGLLYAFLLRPEPAQVAVQYIYISLLGSGTPRTQQAAEKLASETLRRARGGEDFNKLMIAYSEGGREGISILLNKGVNFAPKVVHDSGMPVILIEVHRREDMVPAFGDLCFKLHVGEVGMTAYNPSTNGWHIIKRLE